MSRTVFALLIYTMTSTAIAQTVYERAFAPGTTLVCVLKEMQMHTSASSPVLEPNGFDNFIVRIISEEKAQAILWGDPLDNDTIEIRQSYAGNNGAHIVLWNKSELRVNPTINIIFEKSFMRNKYEYIIIINSFSGATHTTNYGKCYKSF